MIDPKRRSVTIDGRVIRPSYMIFELCRLLYDGNGAVFTKTQIMDRVGISEKSYDTSAQKLASRARALGITQIKTLHGAGYYWEA